MVGLGRRPGPAGLGYAGKSLSVFPLLSLPAISAIYHGQKVEELRSQAVKEERRTKGRPQPLGRRPGGDGHSSTSRLLNFSILKFREQSENVNENKESSSREVKESRHGRSSAIHRSIDAE